MKRRTMGLLVAAALLALLVAGLAPGPARAQERNPVSHAEFISLLQKDTPIEEIVALFKERGVSFKVTPRLQEELDILDVKGDDRRKLLDAITAPGSIELTSNVAQAEIILDGEPAGQSSAEGQATLADLAPGLHTVRLKHRDFVSDGFDVFLKPGEVRRVEFDLQPAVTVDDRPLGQEIRVAAGTAADEALSQLSFVSEPEKRVPLLRRFIARFSHSPVALLGQRMLQKAYFEQEQYDLAIAAGEQVLERDPEDFSARILQARAYVSQGEPGRALDFAARALEQLEQLQQAPAPEGVAPEEWKERKKRMFNQARADLGNLSYYLFVSASNVQDPARKTSLLERYLQLFPKSSYTTNAYVQLAFAAQQQNDTEAFLRWAGKGLDEDPDQPYLLVVVADTLSEKGQQLDRARQLATRLLDLIENRPEKARPEGMDDQQWQARKRIWQGTAHSILGQVLLHEETAENPNYMQKTRQAVREFVAAKPLLQGDKQSYARNLFRLGFAYAKLGSLAEARDALQEVISLGTPYTAPAQQVLDKVNARLGRR